MSQAPVITQEQVEDFLDLLRVGACPADGKGLVDLVAGLEDVKSAVCAVQAEASVAFDAVRRGEQAASGVPAHRQGRGVAAEVALARRESPHRGQVFLGLGKVLVAEMRHTLARLRDGSLSEFPATLIARETACLDVEHRIAIDEALCSDPAKLVGVGTRELVGRVKRLAAELDPAALAKRARQAEADRKVSVRPAPDTMTYLTALLPVAQGVAVFACLGAAADRLRASGDPRARVQLMADLLVARVTGEDLGTGTEPPAVSLGVNITVPVTTLAGGHDAATVSADGVSPETLPAEVARLLLAQTLDAGVARWFRTVCVNPGGRLVAMSSRQRTFPPALADFLAIRGQGICATAWCDAPIRHSDHIQPANERGPTSEANGQGLCEACNHAKQAEGWQQHVISAEDDRQAVETITPTGHRYQATAPPPVGWFLSA